MSAKTWTVVPAGLSLAAFSLSRSEGSQKIARQEEALLINHLATINARPRVGELVKLQRGTPKPVRRGGLLKTQCANDMPNLAAPTTDYV